MLQPPDNSTDRGGGPQVNKFDSVSVMATRCHYHGAGTGVATGVLCLMPGGGGAGAGVRVGWGTVQ